MTFTCADGNLADGAAGSGLSSCSTPGGSSDLIPGAPSGTARTSVAGEGQGQQVVAHAADQAGNAGQRTTAVSIDTTSPVVAADVASGPNDAGWYRQPVTVGFTCTDPVGSNGTAGSGISSCPAPKVLSADGAAQSAVGTASDVAGNSSTPGEADGLNIDQTAPSITGATTARPDGSNGWFRHGVVAHFTAGDALSGLDPATAPADVRLTRDGAAQQAGAEVADRAGNTSSATVGGINIDTTAPSVSVSQSAPARGGGGWYGAPVTLTFSCADATSGLAAGSCPAQQVLGDGRHAAQTLVVTDRAGNATTVAVPEVDVDTVAPALAFGAHSATYAADQTVRITCTASDALSGLDTVSCPSVDTPAYTLPLGTTTLNAAAVDVAGNSSTTGTSYTVTISCSSLKALVDRFSTSPGVASGLDAKVDAVCSAATARARTGAVGAFGDQVRSQIGKSLTGGQAAVLTTLFGGL